MNNTIEQEKAIHEIGQNILVSAGAGCGKTYVLTNRVVDHLLKGIKINEMLILTFTNDAANEMKNRIRKAISSNPLIKDNLKYLESSYITTFDAFSLSTVKKYHYLLNIPKDINIIDSTLLIHKKSQIMDEVFSSFYENINENFAKLINDLCVKNDNSLKDSIIKMANKIELIIDKYEYLDELTNNLNEKKYELYLEEYLHLIDKKIEGIESGIYEIDSINSDFAKKLSDSLKNLLNAKTYDEIKKAINSYTLPRKPKDSDDISLAKNNIDLNLRALKELIRFSSEDEIIDTLKMCESYIKAIILIIKNYEEKLDEYKKQNNLYEFIDIEMMLIKFFKNNPKILDAEKNFFKEIMVDEYQDTSDIQEEFLRLFDNNNLYMVGDVKQSIYGFRNANSKIFMDKYLKYKENDGGIALDLTVNFRSNNTTLDAINEIFSLIMDLKYSGADYKKSHKLSVSSIFEKLLKKFSFENKKIEIYNYDTNDNYLNEEIEAFIIGNDILNKIKSKYMVLDNEEQRECNLNDFCIIMDRGSAFETYKKVFEYLGIPLFVHEDKTLTFSEDLSIIKNILGLIIKIKESVYDLDFKYHFLAVARSYLFKLSDDEIYKIVTENKYSETEIYKICKSISNDINNLTLSMFLKRIINDFHFFENLIMVSNINDRIVAIDNLIKITENLETIGYSIYDFQNYLTLTSEKEIKIKYKNTDNPLGCVKLMNIHKSKGLEFKICYYSGFYKTFNKEDIKDSVVFDKKYGIITPYFAGALGRTILYDLLKDKYNVELVSEEIRKLYVALTRAKEKIIIVCPIKNFGYASKNGVDEVVKEKYNSFLSIIESIALNFKDSIKNISLSKLNITKDYLKEAQKKNIASDNDEKIIYKKINIDNEIIKENHASKKINKLLSKDEINTLRYGSKIHEIFEYSSFNNIKDDSYFDVINTLKEKLNIDNNTKIFKEHEFIFTSDSERYHGIIDLVLEFNDKVVIVDYKLKNTDDDAYLNQLNIYEKYIKSHLSKKIEIYLYSIVNKELKKIK